MAKKKVEKDERAERLSNICKSINNGEFGGKNKDAITWLGSRESIVMERFSSGHWDIDKALGGGWPRGRFIEIYGPESGGKSTLVLHAIAEHQKKYPEEDCALVDTEFSFDEEYATNIGVNTKYLLVLQPDSGEQALNIVTKLVEQGIKCIAVDSVAALLTQVEIDGNIGDSQIALQARLMSSGLKKLSTLCGKNKTTVFWTNQLRERIGVMFGEKTITPAGRALRHYASIRASVYYIGKNKASIEGESTVVSTNHKIDIRKNKTAPPFKVVQFPITFGRGIDMEASLLDKAISLGIVKKRGAWYSFEGEQIGQGREACMESLRQENIDWANRIKEACKDVVVEEYVSSEMPHTDDEDVDEPGVVGEEDKIGVIDV